MDGWRTDLSEFSVMLPCTGSGFMAVANFTNWLSDIYKLLKLRTNLQHTTESHIYDNHESRPRAEKISLYMIC